MAKIIKRNIEMNQLLKESVRMALIDLMKKTEVLKISITDICKRAGVSRQGFYRNYKSKEEVLSEITRDFISNMYEKIGSYFDVEDDKKYEWYVHYFKFITAEKEKLMIIYNSNLEAFHLHEANKSVAEHLEILEVLDRYKKISFVGAIHNITTYWLVSNSELNVNDIAKYAYNSIEK